MHPGDQLKRPSWSTDPNETSRIVPRGNRCSGKATSGTCNRATAK